MAIYEYLCGDCGVFTAMQPMRNSALPQPCPDCGALSARAWVTPPGVAGMSAALRHAHSTNERARHEPRLASQSGPLKKHGSGCSCCTAKPSRSTLVAPSGEKSFPTKRPWMISH